MIISCDTCGVGAFDTETQKCSYCAEVAAHQTAAAAEAARKKALESPAGAASILDGSVAVVSEAVAAITDVGQLEALASAEAAGRNRKGIADAIEARKKALESPAS